MGGRLIITCPDGPGIISAVSTFLAQAGANIVRSDQYSSDPEGGTFFLPMEFTGGAEDLADRFGAEAGERFDMDRRLSDVAQRKRVAVLVSREDHCRCGGVRPAFPLVPAGVRRRGALQPGPRARRARCSQAPSDHCQDRVLRHGDTTVVF